MTNQQLNLRLETVRHIVNIAVSGMLLAILIWCAIYRKSFTNELYISSGAIQSMANDYGQVARATVPAMNALNKTVEESDATLKAATAAVQQSAADVHTLVGTVTPQVNKLITDSQKLIITANEQVESNGKETQSTIKRLGIAVDDASKLLTGDEMKTVLANIGASAKNIRVVTENIPPEDVKALMDSLRSSGANVEVSTAQLAGVTQNLNAISKDLAVDVHTTLNPPKPVGFLAHLKYYAIQSSWVLKDGYLLLKLFGAAP